MGGRGVRSSAYGGWVKTDRTQFRFRPQPYTPPSSMTTTSRERGFPERIQIAPPPAPDGSIGDTVGGILGAIAKVPEIAISAVNEPTKAIFGERGVIGAAADFLAPTPIGAGVGLLNEAFDTTSRMVGVAGNSYDMMLLRQIKGLPDGAKLPQELDIGADPIGAAVTSLFQIALTPMTIANVDRAMNRQGMTVGQFKSLMLQRGMTPEQVQGVMDGSIGQFDPSLGNVRMFDDGGVLGQSMDFATRMAFDPLNIAFGVGGKALRAVGMGMDAARMASTVKALKVFDETSTATARATGTALAAGGKTLAEGGTLNPTMKALGHMLSIDKATLKTGVRRAGIGMVGFDAGVVAADAALTPLIGLFGEEDQSGLLHQMKSFTEDVINDRPLSESSAFMVLTAAGLPIHEIGGAYFGTARRAFRDVTGPRLRVGLREAIGRDLYGSLDRDVSDAWVTHTARTLAARDLKLTQRYQDMFSGGVVETAAARAELVGMLDRHIERMVKDRRINAKAIREEIKRQDEVTVGFEEPEFRRRFDAQRAVDTWTEYHGRAGRVAEILDRTGLTLGFGTEVWKEQLSLIIDDLALTAGVSVDRMALLDTWSKGGTVGQRVGRLKRENPDLYARIKAEVTPAGKKKSDLSAAIGARVDELTSGTAAAIDRAHIDAILSAYPALREMDIRNPSPDGFTLYRYTRGDSPGTASFDDVYRHLSRLRDDAPTEAELFGKVNEAEAAMGDQARPSPASADDFRAANDAAGPAGPIRRMEESVSGVEAGPAQSPAERLDVLTKRIKALEKEAGKDSSIPADLVAEQQAINLEIEAIRREHPELRPNPKAELAAMEAAQAPYYGKHTYRVTTFDRVVGSGAGAQVRYGYRLDSGPGKMAAAESRGAEQFFATADEAMAAGEDYAQRLHDKVSADFGLPQVPRPEPQAAPYGPGNVNPATGYPDDLPFGGSGPRPEAPPVPEEVGGLVAPPTTFGVARVTTILAEVPGGESIRSAVATGLKKMGNKRYDQMADNRVEEILALLAHDARNGKVISPDDVARAFMEPRPLPLEAKGLHWASDVRQQYNNGYISEATMREAAQAQAMLQDVYGDILGDKYAVRVAPKDRIPVEEIGKSLPESMLKSKLIGDILYDHPATSWMSSFMEAVLHPVRNTDVAQAARQAWYDQFVGRYNARPDEVARFTAGLAEELKSNVANRTGMLMYRGITAMPAQRINLIAERTLSEKTLAAIREAGDTPDRILDRGANRFIQKMHVRQTSVGGADRGRLVKATDSFLPGAIEKTYQAWQASMPGGVARAISKVYYFQLRFLLDPRWWAMNGPEADALAAAQYGVWATRAEGAQRAAPTAATATLDLGRVPKEGELAAREEMFLASDQGSSMYVRHRGGYVTTIVENKVRGNIEREVMQVTPTILDGLAESDPLSRALIARFGRDPKSWSNQLYDMLYGFDKDGVKPTVDAEVRKLWTQAEVTPEFEAFIDRIAQVNKRTFDDVTHIMSGNMNRSNMERAMNSYWLYWPLSYQLKTGKWLLDVMTKHSVFGPNASGAVRIEEIRQQHIDRMMTDESYAGIFADNPTLWFTAQMIVPLTPWDMGVSLSRIPRYVGGWLGLWPEYKSAQDPIDAAIQVTKLGPLYTLELARNIRRETFD